MMNETTSEVKILYALDLGENTYSPKQRMLYFWGGLIITGLCILAFIMALRQREAFFFEVMNPALFAILGLWFSIESRKDRLYPPNQYFVRLSAECIEFRSPLQKKPEKLFFQHIKEVKLYWDKITIKVSGTPLYHIHVMDRKRAKVLLQKITEHMELVATPA